MESKSECPNGADREDRISHLPDGVRVHILSYIPTVYSVRTMVLSRRWKNLWSLVPTLDFDQQDYPAENGARARDYIFEFDTFKNFVDGMLSLHSSSTIRKFRLHLARQVWLRDEDFPRIGHWIRIAMRHEVCELDLSLFSYRGDKIDLKLPPTVVLCKTLEVLKVKSNCITYPRTSPGCFPSLKLADITAIDADNFSITKLFCNCPVLEELRIQASFYENDVEFNVSAPELQTLRTSICVYKDREVKGISINAPKLENFFVSGGLTEYILRNAKPLVRASIEDCPYSLNSPFLLNRATALLANISSAEYLHLSGPNLVACSLPNFSNLKQLKLCLSGRSYLEYLMELLKRSPKLEDLVLKIDFNSWYNDEYVKGYAFELPEIVPVCVASNLRTVALAYITGHDDQLDVVKYLLRYGQVLRNVTISTCDLLLFKTRQITEEKFKREILMYPKSSNTCEVEVKFENELIFSGSCSDCGSVFLRQPF